MTRQARRPADNLRMMVMAAAMNPNAADGSRAKAKDGSEDDDRFSKNDTSFGGRLIVTSFLSSFHSPSLSLHGDPEGLGLG